MSHDDSTCKIIHWLGCFVDARMSSCQDIEYRDVSYWYIFAALFLCLHPRNIILSGYLSIFILQISLMPFKENPWIEFVHTWHRITTLRMRCSYAGGQRSMNIGKKFNFSVITLARNIQWKSNLALAKDWLTSIKKYSRKTREVKGKFSKSKVTIFFFPSKNAIFLP